MTVFKALAACASVAAGAAALGLVAYLQSDPLAFTSHRPKNLLTLDWPSALFGTVAEPSADSSVMQLDAIIVEGRLKRPPPARQLVVSIEPPCIPGWRALLPGPEERNVGDVCPDALAPAGLPGGAAARNVALERRFVPKSPHGQVVERPIREPITKTSFPELGRSISN